MTRAAAASMSLRGSSTPCASAAACSAETTSSTATAADAAPRSSWTVGHPAEADKCDRGVAVLALAPSRREVLAQGSGTHDRGGRGPRRPAPRHAAAPPCARRKKTKPPRLGLAELLGLRCARRRGAHDDLAGLRGVLHRHGQRRSLAGEDQLTVRGADEEEVEAAAVHTDVHPERHLARRGLERAEPSSVRRIPYAALQARCVCASPLKKRSRASPPNFTSPPPFA